jgi:integrase
LIIATYTDFRETQITDVKTGFSSVCRDAKIKDFRFHDLRRTGATRLGEGGADAFYITAILGHDDVNTSKVYTIRHE